MKKFIVAVLVVCMVAMMGMAAFAADAVVTKFDAADIEAFLAPQDLSGFGGITAPTLSKVDGGVKVECDEKSSVQSFLIKDADVLKAVSSISQKYVRVYVEAGSADIALRLTWKDSDSNEIAIDCSSAVLIGNDGSKPKITTTDGGSFGTNSAVVIPANFKGYAFFAMADMTMQGPWNKGSYDASKLAMFVLDIRNGQNSSYILREVALTDSTEGPVATADVTTIAFAAAALVSCGALTVVKKRK